MMRLIDADTLKNNVLKWMPSDPCEIVEKEHPVENIIVSLMMEIEEAPTIEPKQGEWIYHRPPDDWVMSLYSCSECGHIEEGKPNFCPNCGAKMKE